MRGPRTSRAETLLEAGRTEVITALCGCMKRLHLGGSAIKTAHATHHRTWQGRRGIDALELLVQATSGAVDVPEEGLCFGCRSGDCSFKQGEAFAKRALFFKMLFTARSCHHRLGSILAE